MMQADEPDSARFEQMAQEAFVTIPAELRRFVEGIAFIVEEFPDDEILDEMEIDDPYDLLGLYQGISLDQESVGTVHHDVTRIFLYREPILDYCDETGETPEWVVRHVLIHEIGHHFGFSDEDMDRIERAADDETDNKDIA